MSTSYKQPQQSPRMPEASEAGQKPPTDDNPVRQRYQMGCHEDGQAGRQMTNSRQFNRGSSKPRRGY